MSPVKHESQLLIKDLKKIVERSKNGMVASTNVYLSHFLLGFSVEASFTISISCDTYNKALPQSCIIVYEITYLNI